MSALDTCKEYESVPLVREFPFTIDNSECDVLIRRPRAEMQKHGLIVARLLDNPVCRGFRLVDKIWIEDIELHGEGQPVGYRGIRCHTHTL